MNPNHPFSATAAGYLPPDPFDPNVLREMEEILYGEENSILESPTVIVRPDDSKHTAWNMVCTAEGDLKPKPNCCCSMVEYDGKLWLFGGGAIGEASCDLYSFDIATQRWTLIAPKIKPTEDSSTGSGETAAVDDNADSLPTTVDEGAVLYGDQQANSSTSGGPARSSDQPRPSSAEATNRRLLSPRINHTAVVYRNKMIVYGGICTPHVPPGTAEEGVDHDPETLSFDFDTLEWSALETVGNPNPNPGAGAAVPPQRRCHTAVMYQSKMYVLMGHGAAGALGDMWTLDLAETPAVWEEIPFLRTAIANLNGQTSLSATATGSTSLFGKPALPVFGHTAVLSNSGKEMLVFGGMCAGSAYTNRLHGYRFQTDTWIEYKAVAPPQMGPSGVGSPEGETAELTQMKVLERRHTSYVPAPPPRYACVSWVDEGGVYIHGGDSLRCTVYFDDLWRFDFGTKQWTNIAWSSRGPRPSSRSGHVAVAVDGVAYVFGGELPSERRELPLSAVRYSNSIFAFSFAYPVSAPLVDLAARWLLIEARAEVQEERTSLLASDEKGVEEGKTSKSGSSTACSAAEAASRAMALEDERLLREERARKRRARLLPGESPSSSSDDEGVDLPVDTVAWEEIERRGATGISSSDGHSHPRDAFVVSASALPPLARWALQRYSLHPMHKELPSKESKTIAPEPDIMKATLPQTMGWFSGP